MCEDELKHLVQQFWDAIIYARDTHQFRWDKTFDNFPRACCRDASDLLARFLYQNGYNTLSVYGNCQGSSHRWLVWDDGQIGEPEMWRFEDVVPSDILPYYTVYGGNMSTPKAPYYRYTEGDIQDCVIIDITADQFKDPPVFCDYWQPIREKYTFIEAEKYEDLGTSRLERLYDIIINAITSQT